MSKSISISFGKPKLKPSTNSTSSTSTGARPPPSKRAVLTVDPEDDNQDDRPPAIETVLGFGADGGAILWCPVNATEERVIENKGNADWRRRGRPAKEILGHALGKREVHLGRTEVERDETSKKAGLQFAEDMGTAVSFTVTATAATADVNEQGRGRGRSGQPDDGATPPQSADEAAVSALLNGDNQNPPPSTTITQRSKTQTSAAREPPMRLDDTLDFREDVASRPEPATLDEYAAMPVEEFGMALLRGMGQKRRANGEVIVIKNPNEPDPDERKREKIKTRDPNMGYLGIGAKAVKIVNGSLGEDGLGAWGKADMRKNKKGEGMYTPVMLRDRRTGELITEAELEDRRKLAKEGGAAAGQAAGHAAGKRTDARDEDDWRERRDRNLDRNGTGGGGGGRVDARYHDDVRDHEPGDLQPSSPSRKMTIQDATRDRPSQHPSSTSSSRRSRRRSHSRSRDGDRLRDSSRGGERYRERSRDRNWNRDRDRDRDTDKYRSGSKGQRHRDRERNSSVR